MAPTDASVFCTMNNLKVLIVGGNGFSAIENYYFRYLQQFGVNVSRFLAPNLFYEYYSKNFLNKIIFRLGLSSVYKLINAQFRKLVELENPDVIWIFKGLEIFPESLQWVKSKKIKLVNYNPDNPFIFSGRGSGNVNITNSISLYDLHFTYDKGIQQEIESNYRITTRILPFGYNLPEQWYLDATAQEEINVVSFVGNPDVDRANFIRKAANSGIEIYVFGYNWHRYINHPNVKIHPVLEGYEFWMVLRRFRIQLNLMRNHNLRSHNMRTFEVAAIGGIQLAPDTLDHRTFFDAEREIFLYTDINQCVDQILKIKSLTGEEVSKVRLAARQRSIESGYDYRSRTRFVLKILTELVEN